MKLANLKGVGKKQLELIQKMYSNKKLFVCVMMDLSNHQHEITLSDDDGNDYEKLNELFFQSLISRKIIIEYSDKEPALNLVVVKYKLNEFIHPEF
jgi:hypothetical protein